MQEESYEFIDNDFPHDKFLTVKTTQKSLTSAIKLKSTFNKKVEGMRLADDAKFWFKVKNDAKLFVRYKENSIKLHYDHGICNFANNRRYNFYAGYQANKNLQGGSLKFGAAYLGETVRCDNRIRVDKFDSKFSSNPEVSLYHRSCYDLNPNWRLQLFAAINFSKMVLLNNAFLIRYRRNEHEFFLRGEAGDWRKETPANAEDLFKEYTFNYVKQLSADSRAGVQVHLLSAKDQGVTAAYERTFRQENATIKWRFNSAMNLAMSIQRSMGSYGSYNVGFEISDLGRNNNVAFGTEFSLNL